MKRYVRKFKENEKTILVKLITNEGKVINKKGYAEEGVGIFDNDGEEYIGGYTSKNELYASNVDEHDYVLNFDGKKTKYKI
jgi:hypothetical protein